MIPTIFCCFTTGSTIRLTGRKGVLLLEIGSWKLLPRLFPGNDAPDRKAFERSKLRDPENFRRFLLQLVESMIAHAVGWSYAHAVASCLKERDWNAYDDWGMQDVVRQEVLAGLQGKVKGAFQVSGAE